MDVETSTTTIVISFLFIFLCAGNALSSDPEALGNHLPEISSTVIPDYTAAEFEIF